MTGRYTNNIQAAIIYEGGDEIYPSLHLNAFCAAMLNNQLLLKVVQEDRHFVLMMGPGEFRILVTYFPRPADAAVFAPTLGSAITTLLMPMPGSACAGTPRMSLSKCIMASWRRHR